MTPDEIILFGFLFGFLAHLEYRIDKIYQVLRSVKG